MGCGADMCINWLLTFLLYFPGEKSCKELGKKRYIYIILNFRFWTEFSQIFLIKNQFFENSRFKNLFSYKFQVWSTRGSSFWVRKGKTVTLSFMSIKELLQLQHLQPLQLSCCKHPLCSTKLRPMSTTCPNHLLSTKDHRIISHLLNAMRRNIELLLFVWNKESC